MKKIAFVSTQEYMPWGGSEELWSQTALRLAGKRFRIGINVKKWEKEHPRICKLEKMGCAVERRLPKWDIFQRIVNKIGLSQRPYNWLDKFFPDLVVLSLEINMSGIEWMKACIDRCIPYVIIVHGGSEVCWPNDDHLDNMAVCYKEAKKSFFVSPRLLDITEMEIGNSLENSQIVQNPYNISFDFQPSMPTVDTIMFACVGSLEPISKGQDILFKVLSLNKWRERPFSVSLYGAGHCERSLLRFKDMLGLDNTRFCGVTNKIETIWETHHALILPSRFEGGGPMVLVEAMLSGRVCIATDVGRVNEFVSDNVDGFVAPAALPYYLDEAMERAWQRREEWRDIGMMAARNMRKKISPDPVGDFIKILETLL